MSVGHNGGAGTDAARRSLDLPGAGEGHERQVDDRYELFAVPGVRHGIVATASMRLVSRLSEYPRML